MQNSTNTIFYNCDGADYSPKANSSHVVFRCRLSNYSIPYVKQIAGLELLQTVRKNPESQVFRDKVELYKFNTINYCNSHAKDFCANHLCIVVLPEFVDELKEELTETLDGYGELLLEITFRTTGRTISTQIGTQIANRGIWRPISVGESPPKYPIAIVSYSRHNAYGKTHLYLTKCRIDHYLFVEPDEYEAYEKWYDPAYCKLIMSNENFSKQGMGSTPMRNYILDHFSTVRFAVRRERVWMLDDNIKGWKRYYQGTKNLIEGNVIFTHIENYVNQYNNVGIASHNFNPYVMEGDCRPCLVKNGKCYSSMLIPLNNDIRFKYKHQEDNLISIEYINAGYCNLCFNSVCYDKETSGRDKGGNAKNIYKVKEGDTDGDGYKERYEYLECILKILFMENKLKLVAGKTVDDFLKRSTTMVSKKYHAKLDYTLLVGNDNEIVLRDDKPAWDWLNNPKYSLEDF